MQFILVLVSLMFKTQTSFEFWSEFICSVSGVDVDCVNHQGQTSLFCAALRGHVKVTDLLLDYGADPNQ